MKNILLVVFVGTFYLTSCNERVSTDAALFVSHIRDQNKQECYLFVINSKSCIRCCPALINFMNKLDEEGLRKDQVHIIVNEMREINRENFFQNNFKISQDRFQCYYNDELKKNLTVLYEMEIDMFTIKYSGDSEQAICWRELK